MSECPSMRKPINLGFPYMLVGYMRVSNDGDRQVMDLQRDALLAAGVDERHLFEDRASGSRDDRAGLAKVLGLPQAGRLSRGVETRPSRAIAAAPARDSEQPEGTRGGVPLADRADGHHHPSGRIPVSCLRSTGAIRAIVDPGAGERGLAAARRRGRRGGRPVAIDAEKMAAVVTALEGGATKAAVCRTFGIKRSTLIDSLTRIGWSADAKPQGNQNDAPAAIDRDPDHRVVRAAGRPA